MRKSDGKSIFQMKWMNPRRHGGTEFLRKKTIMVLGFQVVICNADCQRFICRFFYCENSPVREKCFTEKQGKLSEELKLVQLQKQSLAQNREESETNRL